MMKKQINIFLIAALMLCGSAGAAVLNEWTFEADAGGLTLSAAANSGIDGVAFSADAGLVTQTDGSGDLVCANIAAGTAGLWTDGAILRADVTNQSAGVRFLRYDFAYDVTAASNDSGTLLGLEFADTTSDNLAGVALKYALPGGANTPPAGIAETVFETDMPLTGSIAVIAEVDLDALEMRVWYNLSGGNSFNAYNAPNKTVTGLNLTTIEELEFRATGDLIASASNESIVIDNIRTATTWDEILTKPADFSGPPELSVSISGSLGDGMLVGQTNLISVTINNNGGPATLVTSTLMHDAGAGLSIISANNAAESIGAGGSAVQTYEVVANADGSYVLTAQATSAETSSAPVPFDLTVGAKITFVPPAVLSNDTGGIFPDEVEPGETFDLTITSVNDGGLTITDITNSLTAANPVYFPTITPITGNTYASMDFADTRSTTYHVTCSPDTPNGLQTFTVINRTADSAWAAQFQINVSREAIPSVSPNALTLRVVPGGSDSASVTLSNVGNVDLSYTVSWVGGGAVQYVGSSPRASMEWFGPGGVNTRFTSWTDGGTISASGGIYGDSWEENLSESIDLGFEMPVYGTLYNSVVVAQHGWIELSGPNGSNKALIAPYASSRDIDLSTIRYLKEADRLVVAWGSHPNEPNDDLEFQVWLNADGTIQYLYEPGTWDPGVIGLQDDQEMQLFDHVPGQVGSDSLLLTPNPWVTFDPPSGTVSFSGAAQTLTVVANDPGTLSTDAAPQVFTARVDGGTESDTIEVTVIREDQTTVEFDVPPEFTFYGPAGYLSPDATLIAANSGSAAIAYTIIDNGLLNAGYSFTNGVYGWQNHPAPVEVLVGPSDLDVTSFDIGFPFVFFGSTYTHLVVNVDGTLTLADGVTIVPHSADFSPGSVRLFRDPDKTWLMVYWEEMIRSDANEGQTFRAILYRDGRMHFDYRTATENWQNAVIELNASGTNVAGTLVTAGNSTTTTNIISYETTPVTNWLGVVIGEEITGTNTEVVTTYSTSASLRGLDVAPGERRVFSVSPSSGIIPGNSTAEITLKGNAETLAEGGPNAVTNKTTLLFTADFVEQDSSPVERTTDVSFIATNSVETAYPSTAVQAAMWGSDTPVVSSTQNADGTRTLTWPAVSGDDWGRTYTVEYTTSLSGKWKFVATVFNGTSYIDDDATRNTEPVIFYRVKVAVQ